VSDGERDLRTGIRDLAAALERGVEDHPAPAELLDFVAGDLPEAERRRIEEHLALCRDCARTALELAESPGVEPVGELLTRQEVAAEWERFRGALAAARPARHATTHRVPWALAASLLAAVIGLAVWNARLRQEARVLGEPRADVAVVDLVPEETVARAGGAEEEVRPPAWADRLVLILNLAEPVAATEFRIEIMTADGRTAWSARGVRRSEDGTFAVEVPRRFLPPGAYRIRLSGLRGAATEPVAEYALRITPG
jgi:anti-sigma factor RsiW